MEAKERIYLAIDLKSFYASVECIERGLDPLKTNLVVADKSRTEKTICLAVSPALKEWGISSRPRLFEVVQEVKRINKKRLLKAKKFTGKSYFKEELLKNNKFELDYIVATPQMSHYIDMSVKIFTIYLKYFSHEDIHVYSIDEVFIDITNYLSMYKLTPSLLAGKVIKDIYTNTGITATCGIGSNLFLAKVSMDILAKHAPANKDGVRMAYLDEYKFRKLFWDHTPLTDFWRIGPGTTRRLNENKMFTLGDVVRKSIEDEDRLYEIFGINAELIIDHAWGIEPTTIKDIKEYKPSIHSLSNGQVLAEPYNYQKTLIVIKEMAEALAFDLLSKKKLSNSVTLVVMYDHNNDLTNYKGKLAYNYYNKLVPYPAHGTVTLDRFTNSREMIVNKVIYLFNHIIDKNLLTRRIFLNANNVIEEKDFKNDKYTQLDLFGDYIKEEELTNKINKENKLNNTLLNIKKRFGKNAVIKGSNLLEGGTQVERNKQIGGHKA